MVANYVPMYIDLKRMIRAMHRYDDGDVDGHVDGDGDGEGAETLNYV